MRSSLNQGKPESNCDLVYNCALQIGRELIKADFPVTRSSLSR